MRRPESLSIASSGLADALDTGKRALDVAIRSAVRGARDIICASRVGAPHPAILAEFSSDEPLGASSRVALDEAYQRELAREGVGSSGSVLRLDAIESLSVSGPRTRLLVTACVWPDRRSWRLDVALHDRAAERSPDEVAERLGLRDREGWRAPGSAVLDAIRRRLEGFGESLGGSRTGAPVETAIARWSREPSEGRSLPARFSSLGSLEASQVVSLLAPEDCARETEHVLGAVETLLRAWGLETSRVEVRRGEVFRVRVANRWGLFASHAAEVSARLEADVPGVAANDLRGIASVRLEIADTERWLDVLLEEHGLDLPAWAAPVQVKILPIVALANPAARALLDELGENGVRGEIDARREEAASKVRQAEDDRVPAFLVIGPRELEEGLLTVHRRPYRGPGTVETLERARALARVVEQIRMADVVRGG